MDLLCDKIVRMFGVSEEEAVAAVEGSAIQALIAEEPEWVDHVALSTWAEMVYIEMLGGR